MRPTEHVLDHYCPVLPARGALGQRKDKATVPGLRELPVPQEKGMAMGTQGQPLHWPSRSARLSPCPQDLPLAGPSFRKTRWWNQQVSISPL